MTANQALPLSVRAENLGLLACAMVDYQAPKGSIHPAYTFRAALALVLCEDTQQLVKEVRTYNDIPRKLERACMKAASLTLDLADVVIDADSGEPEEFSVLADLAEESVSALADALISLT
jgi:hypothetical protein